MHGPDADAPNRVNLTIKALMGMTGASQKDVGEALGIDQSRVSRRLRDGTWTIADVDALARYFEVPIATFFEDPRTRFDQGKRPSAWITECSELAEVTIG